MKRIIALLAFLAVPAMAHAVSLLPGEWVVRRIDAAVIQEKDLRLIPTKIIDGSGEHSFKVFARHNRVIGVRTDEAGAEMLRRQGFSVEPNYTFELLGTFTPAGKSLNDWYLQRISQRGAFSPSGTGPVSGMLPARDGVVYVLDTYAYDGLGGEQFGDRLVRGPDFTTVPDDPSNPGCRVHGSAMAALVHAVNPSALIVSVRIGRCDNMIDGVAAHAAMDWLSDVAAGRYGPGPINMSWGLFLDHNPYAKEFVRLAAAGFITATAAGNDGLNASAYAPCAWANLCLGASNKEDRRGSFSNYGKALSFFAPGEDIEFIGPDGNEWSASGTSVSTPLAVGTWSLLRGAFLSLPPSRLTSLLVVNATRGALSDVGEGSPNRLLYAGAVTEQVGQNFFRYFRSAKKFSARVNVVLNGSRTESQRVAFYRGGKGANGRCQGTPYAEAPVGADGFAAVAVSGWANAPARGCFETELGSVFERQVVVLP